MNLEEFDEN